MAVKKSELYNSLWSACDELRGGMDASQYKDYVLVLLFVKYVTDKYKGNPNSLIEVPDEGSFDAMIRVKNDKNIGDKINTIISTLAKANDLQGVIDVADFNDDTKLGTGQNMVDTLTNLIAIFENPDLDFSKNKSDGDDLLGDAYEYLMRHFATESGKSKGQFYTPSEVSLVMSKVIGVSQAKSKEMTIYDPTCGSGSLLLKAADQSPVGITIYGQEKDNATVALAKMNMILHDQPTAEIHQDNTLSSPFFKTNETTLKTFDFVVANPPFSNKSWSNGFIPSSDIYKRFEDGIPPEKNGDYAFLLHILKSLKSTGKGAVILPHGVLFRGNSEEGIRTNIIKKGYIKGVIGLPVNLFYGTGIPACIIVFDKEFANIRKDIFFIDASKGFVKDGNKNRLRQQDIQKIVDVFTNQLEISHYSRLVSLNEIEKNGYNLNIPRYIDSGEKEDIQDIHAHLQGGIPNSDIEDLRAYWQVFPQLRQKLFSDDNKNSYSEPLLQKDEANQVIRNDDEFKAFKAVTISLFTSWWQETEQSIRMLGVGLKPKELVLIYSKNLLHKFSTAKLLDKYDVYQVFMTYWTETLQDDLYMISQEGWKVDIKAILYTEGKNKGKEKKGEWISELLPKPIVIDKFFTAEKEEIDTLGQENEELDSQMKEIEEENSGDDGIMEDMKNESGKISLNDVKAKVKEYRNKADYKDEYEILTKYLEIVEKIKNNRKKINELSSSLDKMLLQKYGSLTDVEIKDILINNKWYKTLSVRLENEIDNIAFRLSQRTQELIDRYETPLPKIIKEVDELELRVKKHLNDMGFNY